MDCSAEEQLVRQRLARQVGARIAGVDLDARTVTVVCDGSSATVLAAIDELGLGMRLVSDEPLPKAADGAGGVGDEPGASGDTGRQRSALWFALVVNAAFFAVEMTAGLISGSMGLVADSLDMLADASVYLLSLLAVGHAVARQRRLAAASGYLQLTLAVLGLVEVVRRFVAGEQPPDVTTMVVVSLLALLANVVVLVALRRAGGNGVHLQAAWIFTSNDVKVNALVIVAALLVAASGSAAPDLVAGALIFAIVANGARRILRLSR